MKEAMRKAFRLTLIRFFSFAIGWMVTNLLLHAWVIFLPAFSEGVVLTVWW